MSWEEKNEELLLKRSFLFGITGIIISLIPLFNQYFEWLNIPMAPINGVGLVLQFFAISIAIMVLRKRKITEQTKDKAKKMILVLGVALIFFFMVI
jgi:membrane-bound ClpP family serine protease